MSEDQPTRDKSSSFNLAKVDWSAIGKLLAILAAILYVLGFLVINEYLASIPMSDFSAFKAQCVFTGTWCLLLLLLALLPGAAALFAVSQSKYNIVLFLAPPLAFVAGWIIFWAGTDALFFYIVPRDDAFRDLWPGQTTFAVPRPMADIALRYAILIMFMPFYWGLKRPPRPATLRVRLALVIVVCIVISLSSTWDLANKIYPRVKKALGGGKPDTVLLVLSKEAAEVWRNICGMQASETPTTTGPLDLIYESQEQLVIRLHSKNIPNNIQIFGPTIKLDKKLVQAISIFPFPPSNESCVQSIRQAPSEHQ